jgi:hypothetical protein
LTAEMTAQTSYTHNYQSVHGHYLMTKTAGLDRKASSEFNNHNETGKQPLQQEYQQSHYHLTLNLSV